MLILADRAVETDDVTDARGYYLPRPLDVLAVAEAGERERPLGEGGGVDWSLPTVEGGDSSGGQLRAQAAHGRQHGNARLGEWPSFLTGGKYDGDDVTFRERCLLC